MLLQGGRKKILLLQENLQPRSPNNCAPETSVMSNTQFLTWNTKIVKNKYCTDFLVNFCEVENICKVSEGLKPVATPLQVSPQWCA